MDWDQLTIPSSDDLFSISITESNIYIMNGDSTSYDDDFRYSALEFFKTSNNLTWTTHFIDDEFTSILVAMPIFILEMTIPDLPLIPWHYYAIVVTSG